MQEIFYEESSKFRAEKTEKFKYYVIKTVSIISYVSAVIWLIFCFSFMPLDNILLALLFILIPTIIFIALGVIFGRIKNKFCVDYDYTFVSGSIRFSKVINNIKRKNVAKFDTSNIVKIGKYGTNSYNRCENSEGVKKYILSSNSEAEDGKCFYYIFESDEDGKRLFVLECTDVFINTVFRFCNRTVLEEELK